MCSGPVHVFLAEMKTVYAAKFDVPLKKKQT